MAGLSFDHTRDKFFFKGDEVLELYFEKGIDIKGLQDYDDSYFVINRISVDTILNAKNTVSDFDFFQIIELKSKQYQIKSHHKEWEECVTIMQTEADLEGRSLEVQKKLYIYAKEYKTEHPQIQASIPHIKGIKKIGCKYCIVDADMMTLQERFQSPNADCIVSICVGNNEVLLEVELNGEKGHLRSSAKYCPYCGRKLGE